MRKRSEPKCEHLFVHLPHSPFKWRCVKCSVRVRRKKYRNLIYRSTTEKEQAQTER